MTKKKVAVAMSGGVDSSLTAALLLKKGFEVIGLTMQLSAGPGDLYSTDRSCCSADEANDARRVADFLCIPHYIVDFREEFRAKVIDNFIAEYLKGRTPNPCIACNRYLKFGSLFNFIDELGIEYLATGHYARIEEAGGKFVLKKGLDRKKDQSYVLYNIGAEQLPRMLLPLGGQSKEETRALAEELDLPVAHKPDSQEICFVPNDDYKAYLSKNADKDSAALQPGEIVDGSGRVLGRHRGAAFYTIGQRKGLGLAHETPLYVTRLDIASRRVVVGSAEEVFCKKLRARDLHWIYPAKFPLRATAKVRYGPRVAACVVSDFNNDMVEVVFDEPQRAVTPGQSIVFYDDDIVLGGGIIEIRN